MNHRLSLNEAADGGCPRIVRRPIRAELARHLDIPYSRLSSIVKGRSPVTPDTALRLSQVVGMSADFWLGLQQDWDFRPEARAIFRLKPLAAAAKGIPA